MPGGKPFVINLSFTKEEAERIEKEVLEEQRKILIKQGLNEEQINAILYCYGKSLGKVDNNVDR